MNHKLVNQILFSLVLLVCLVAPLGHLTAPAGAASASMNVGVPGQESTDSESLRGTLVVLWIDRQDGLEVPPQFSLVAADGRESALLPGQVTETELLELSGREVVVSARPVTAPAQSHDELPRLAVDAIRPTMAEPTTGTASAVAAGAPVLGNTKWVTIGCKFPDRLAEEHPLSYFDAMYANTFPGLNHFWRELSFDQMNLDGSHAVGWYVLPRSYSSYFNNGGGFLKEKYRDDCLAAADNDVYFPDYYGINLIINGDDLDYATGGRLPMTLDGLTRLWGITWMSQWTHEWISEFEHEMGHAYDLWHSYSGLSPYGNPWDVMSRDEYNCQRFSDPVYGCYGQHTNARNKKHLGWIAPERIYTAGPGVHSITLERTSQPGANGYLMAEIPINGAPAHYYTLEARQLVGYDHKLPGAAVIIHEIGGSNRMFELVSMGGVGNPNMGEGDTPNAMWLPGETFSAPYGGITVRVDAATPTGFTVTIHNGLSSATSVLTPTDDTTIRRAAPNTNYGGEPVLQAEPKDATGWINTWGAIRFETAAIPASAYRIKLRVAVVNDAGTVAPGVVYRLNPYYSSTTTNWTEYGLTWNNNGDVIPVSPLGNRTGSWLEANLTFGYGQSNALEISSLALSGEGAPGLVTFSSKEGADPPQLIVDYWVLPETTIFTPTNDAHVMSNKKAVVFNKPRLQVRDTAADTNSYIKFNVQGLEGTVTQATLRLWVADAGPDGGAVYTTSPFYKNTTTQWLETGLKWTNAPTITGAPLGSLGAVTAGGWVELDVTPAVTGNGRVSLALTNNATNLVAYSSKEGGHAPELIVTTE